MSTIPQLRVIPGGGYALVDDGQPPAECYEIHTGLQLGSFSSREHPRPRNPARLERWESAINDALAAQFPCARYWHDTDGENPGREISVCYAHSAHIDPAKAGAVAGIPWVPRAPRQRGASDGQDQ